MATGLRTKKLSRSRKATVTRGVRTVVLSEEEMWKNKRERQRQDIEGLKDGTLSGNNVSWFSGGVARRAKIIGSIF